MKVEGGTFSITKATLKVTAENLSKAYGAADPELTWTVDGLKDGDTKDLLTVEITRGEGENVGHYVITPSGAAEIANYTIEYQTGDFEITKAAITLKADDKTKVYDNNETTDPVLTATVTGAPENGAEPVYTLSREPGQNVGEYVITVTVDEDANPNYAITVEDGIFAITSGEVTVTITGNSARLVYNGAEQSVTGYTVAIDSELYTEDKISGPQQSEAVAKGMLVGEYSMNLTEGTFTDEAPGEQFANTDPNFKVRFIVINGLLTISDGTGPDEEPVDDSLVVAKKDANGAEGMRYALNDVVTFEITATNIYQDARTITLKEIEGVTLDQSVFENVAGGQTITATATYTITENDILNGSFTNTVTAEVGGVTKTADATVSMAESNPHLTVTKSVTTRPNDGKGYTAGEVIGYSITVLNDGNLTISDISIQDRLPGFAFDAGQATDGIVLAPGASVTATGTYTVTEADQAAGSVVNQATATGVDPDPDKDPVIVPGTAEEPTQTEVTLTVRYFSYDPIFDEMDEMTDMTFRATYKAGDSYYVASPKLTGYKVDQASVSGIINTDTTLTVIYTMIEYTLTIRYRFTTGGEAAPSQKMSLYYGDMILDIAPQIEGYECQMPFIEVTMPAHDMEITVYYAPIETEERPVIITEYGTPLGLDSVSLNLGECIE